VSPCCSLLEGEPTCSDSDVDMTNTPSAPAQCLHVRFCTKAVETTPCGQIALFQTERLCLISGVAAPDLGCVVQDHIQQ
jgi:hypothetical protein